MNAMEMAERLVQLAGPNARPNAGQKSAAYSEARNELIACCGPEWAKQLTEQAFTAVGRGPYKFDK